MKFFLVCGLWSLVCSPVFAQAPLSLKDCFDLALKRSESVAIEEQNIRLAESQFSQALSTILPKVSFKGSELLQDDPSSGSGGSSVGSTLTRFSRPEFKFNAKQPLFSGFREFFAMKAARSEKAATKAEWENAKRLLFLDVAKSFYAVVELQKEVETLNGIGATLQNRLRELDRRAQLGKSRESEKINTESELSQAQAVLSETRGALVSAKAVLHFLTGSEIPDLADETTPPETPFTQRELLGKIQKRPDLKAADESVKASKALVAAERGAHWPSLNAEANYYTYRVGFQEDIKWDALFSLDFPIFQGGQTHAKIQEAKIRAKQQALHLSEKERMAQTEIEKSFNEWQSSKQQVAAFQTALDKANKSYRVTEEDYRLGLVNNLEVLTTLRNLQEVQRNFQKALYQEKINYFSLKAAAGEALP